MRICTQPKEVLVDLGFRGVDVQLGTKVRPPKLRSNITQRLRRNIRHRNAIEPAIEHMKNDGRLRPNWLTGKKAMLSTPCCAAGRQISHCGVQPHAVVEVDDGISNVILGLGLVDILALPDTFHFEVQEEAPGYGIFPAIAKPWFFIAVTSRRLP